MHTVYLTNKKEAMGLADYTVAAWDVITEIFSSATKADGIGTSEKEANCDMEIRTSSWGQGKEIS